MAFDHFSYSNPNSRWDRFKSIRYDPKLAMIEKDLRDLNIWEEPRVQILLRRAKKGTDKARISAIIKLKEYIENYRIEFQRNDFDPFMPYATYEQISNNGQGIHICDQVNSDIPLIVPRDLFLHNTVVLGRPQGGKSSGVFFWLSQLDLSLLVIDPKNMWNQRANALGSKVLKWPYSISLQVPGNVAYNEGIDQYIEGISQVTGIQYGLVPLLEAAQIAIRQRAEYARVTGKQTELCLRDIYEALSFVNIKSLKKDYILSAMTAMKLILGPNQLFETRKGIPLNELLNGNYILPVHKLIAIQCQGSAIILMLYVLMISYEQLERIHLETLTVFDDSSAFISLPVNLFGNTPKVSIWDFILKKLRCSGKGIIFIEHDMSSIYDGVKNNCTNWVIIGGLQDANGFREIASIMNLTDQQVHYISKMQTRECIAYFPTHYPRPIHGYIPEVTSIDEDSQDG